MIYVRLMGGLGNQMFQYAAARRLALKRRTGLTLDKSHYLNQPADEVPREYELDCFTLPAKLTDRPAESKPGLFKRAFAHEVNVVNEKDFTFDPGIMDAPDNTLLIGYWQSEKYFLDEQDQIRSDLTFTRPLSAGKQTVADQIAQTTDPVAFQVRRGDFAQHHVSSQFHGLASMDYYEKAVQYVAKKVKNPTFFVVSDDSEWCKQNIKLDYPTVFVEHVPGTGQEDMNLLSRCRHHIIANSSYGWWGAWLAKNEKQIVIAPRVWFKAGGIDTRDLLPEQWIRM